MKYTHAKCRNAVGIEGGCAGPDIRRGYTRTSELPGYLWVVQDVRVGMGLVSTVALAWLASHKQAHHAFLQPCAHSRDLSASNWHGESHEDSLEERLWCRRLQLSLSQAC